MIKKGGLEHVILNVIETNIANNEIKCVNKDGDSIILNTNSYNPVDGTLKIKMFNKGASKYENLILKIKDLKFWRDNELFIPPSIKPNYTTDDDEDGYLKPLNYNELPNEILSLKKDDLLSIVSDDNLTYNLIFTGEKNGYYYFKNNDNNVIRIDEYGWDDDDNSLILQLFNDKTNNYLNKKIIVRKISVNDNIKNDDVDIFKKYYNDILKDPNVRSAFYTAPSLWNYFLSAMKNKKAVGSGIYPAYQLINSYYNKKIDKKLPGFTNKQNKRAEFIFTTPIDIEYYNENRRSQDLSRLSLSGKHAATVRPYKGGDGDNKVLINNDEGFKLKVKKPTNEKPDEYYCDVFVYKKGVIEDKFGETNVIIRFLDSDGYEPVKNV